MSYEFTLVLNREITDDESAMLEKEGCAGATRSTDRLPTNADLIVTRLDFDIEGPSLAEVIESALAAVKTVPELSAASLTVPAQPDGSGSDGDDEAASADASANGSANGDAKAKAAAEPKAGDAAAKPKAAARKRSSSSNGSSRSQSKQPKRRAAAKSAS